MNVQLDPHCEQLVEQQLRAGRFQTPEEVIARALETLAQEEPVEGREASQAVDDMLAFAAKHRLTLGEGLRIRDLIHEGHKY